METMRRNDELRQVRILPDYTEMAAGSVLVCCGRTRVLCTASVQDGVPPFLKGKGTGWLTAEYAMLPGATPQRKARDGVKKDGRSVEIQRLIGRSLRAACDLSRMGERTVYIDCDVLQADGGTRTASISGAYVAAKLAVRKFMEAGKIKEDPFTDSVAAISVGIYQETPILDLCYVEDKDAAVDANVVMTGTGRFVELQSSGEEATFSPDELAAMIALGKKGVAEITEIQKRVLKG